MKPAMLYLLITVIFISGCATAGHHDDSWFGKDKAAHFILSSVIAGTAAAAAKNRGMDNSESFSLSLGVPLLMGAGKETYDIYIRKSYGSWKDMTWNLIGALTGYSLVEAADRVR